MNDLEDIQLLISKIYPRQNSQQILSRLQLLIDKYQINSPNTDTVFFDEKEIVLITYGDSLLKKGEPPLAVLRKFADKYLQNIVSTIHILPFFPYSSDDGFSVIDYTKVNPELGNWDDIRELKKNFKLMYDFVLNHISSQSDWFRKYLSMEEGYENLAIEVDPKENLSMVTRPRALPLLSEYEKDNGEKVHVWTTFSRDQIDLNFSDVETFLRMIEILLFYASKGASIIRMDAIAYLWKEVGTNCIHLEKTHLMVKLFRKLYNLVNPSGIIITETNVPHAENISYFGNGNDEAQMAYNFTLPPLLLYSFISGDITIFNQWAGSLELPSGQTTFFNFTASHDGIGVRPLEGIVKQDELQKMVDHVIQNQGKVSYKQNSDGSQTPYELNITYVDAYRQGENDPFHAKRFIASQSIPLVLPGVPAIYIHSLVGSHNWLDGVAQTGRNRTINREKLDFEDLEKEIHSQKSFRNFIFNKYLKLLMIRREHKVFHPNSGFKVIELHPKLFCIKRFYNEKVLIAITNISMDEITISQDQLPSKKMKFDLISSQSISDTIKIEAYGIKWLINYT